MIDSQLMKQKPIKEGSCHVWVPSLLLLGRRI